MSDDDRKEKKKKHKKEKRRWGWLGAAVAQGFQQAKKKRFRTYLACGGPGSSQKCVLFPAGCMPPWADAEGCCCICLMEQVWN